MGLGIVLTEAHHGPLLMAAVLLSLGISALRARQAGTWTPFLLSVLGGSALIGSHLAGESLLLTALGVLLFLTAAGWSLRRKPAPHSAPPAAPFELRPART